MAQKTRYPFPSVLGELATAQTVMCILVRLANRDRHRHQNLRMEACRDYVRYYRHDLDTAYAQAQQVCMDALGAFLCLPSWVQCYQKKSQLSDLQRTRLSKYRINI